MRIEPAEWQPRWEADKSQFMRFGSLFLLITACGPTTTIDVKNYSQTCASNADCIAIVSGDQCKPCTCPNAAIAASDQVLYEADRTETRVACGGISKVACGPCEARRPTCVELPNPLGRSGQFFCELR